MRKIIVIIDVSFGEKYAVVGGARKAEPAAADVIMRAAVSIGFPHARRLAANGKGDQPKKGRSYEECQKRTNAAGLNNMGAMGGKRGGNPTDPNAKGWIAQCMRGEI